MTLTSHKGSNLSSSKKISSSTNKKLCNQYMKIKNPYSSKMESEPWELISSVSSDSGSKSSKSLFSSSIKKNFYKMKLQSSN